MTDDAGRTWNPFLNRGSYIVSNTTALRIIDAIAVGERLVFVDSLDILGSTTRYAAPTWLAVSAIVALSPLSEPQPEPPKPILIRRNIT